MRSLLHRDFCSCIRSTIAKWYAPVGSFVTADRLGSIGVCTHFAVRYDKDLRIMFYPALERGFRKCFCLGDCHAGIQSANPMVSDHRCHCIRHGNVGDIDVHIFRGEIAIFKRPHHLCLEDSRRIRMNQVHAEISVDVLHLRSIHKRFRIRLCVNLYRNCVRYLRIAAVKLRDSGSGKRCFRTRHMLHKNVVGILCRHNDRDRALVLPEVHGKISAFFRIVPALYIDVSGCHLCVCDIRSRIAALAGKCSACSDRAFSSVRLPDIDLRLCERIQCRIDFHIVPGDDHAHPAAVHAALDPCKIEELISRCRNIHCLHLRTCQSARIHCHDHIRGHSLLIRSGKD